MENSRSTPQHQSFEELTSRVDRLQEELKEREFSFLRSLKTLSEDLFAWKQGARDFPKAALLGAVFAYLRPRVVIVIAGLIAAVMGSLQVWLLLSQNRLIHQQNEFIKAQTRANRVEAIQSVLAGLGDLEPFEPGSEAYLMEQQSPRYAIALAQLTSYGSEGVAVLRDLASNDGALGFLARQAAVASAETITSTQRAELLPPLLSAFVHSWPRADFPADGLEGGPRYVRELYLFREFLRKLVATGDDYLPLPRGEEMFFRELARLYGSTSDTYRAMAGQEYFGIEPTVGEVEALASLQEVDALLTQVCRGPGSPEPKTQEETLLGWYSSEEWTRLEAQERVDPPAMFKEHCSRRGRH